MPGERKRQALRALVAPLLALAVLLASLPLVTGVILQDQTPAFTLDICHPLQSQSQSPSVVPLPPPAAGRGQPVSVDFGHISDRDTPAFIEFIADINPPPPKRAA